MGTENLNVQYTATKQVYFSIWNNAGQILDFNDKTFKAVGSATTPGLAATEYTGPGGSSSFYGAALNLADVQKGGAVGQYWIAAYERVGGSPAPATDTVIGTPQLLEVQFAAKGAGHLHLEVAGAFLTTAGLEVRFIGSLHRNGERVPLETLAATATLALAVREQGAGADLYTIAATTVNGVGAFELTKTTPGYTADRVYKHTWTLVENGNTHEFVTIVPNHG